MIPIFHQYSARRSVRLKKATFRDRAIAQFIDGIFLGILSSLWFFVWSNGDLYSVWISPVFPVYLLQVKSGVISSVENWLWGGYFWSFHLYGDKFIYLSLPSPLLILIYGLYYTFFISRFGQTPGKMMKALVILDSQRKILTFSASMKRWLWTVISLLFLGVGFWWNIFSKSGKAWHDYFSDTEVFSFHPYL